MMKIYFPGNFVPEYLIKVIPLKEDRDRFMKWFDSDQGSQMGPWADTMLPPVFTKYALGVKSDGKWFVRPLFTTGSWEMPIAGTGTLSSDNLHAYMEPWWQYWLRKIFQHNTPK